MIAAVVVTACSATGPTAARLAVQTTAAELRVIAFDAHAAIGAMSVRDGMPKMPVGDWLVGFAGRVTARLSPDVTLRWSRS